MNCKKTVILIHCVLLLSVTYTLAESGAVASGKARYNGIVTSMARKYDVPPDLIHSIIKAESNYNSRAVSHKGAVGLMQLMPATAEYYGVKDSYDPKENIEGGVKYLNDLVKLYDYNTKLVLAAYNAGQEAVKKYKGIPPYLETRNYIKKVMSSYNKEIIRRRTTIYRFRDEQGRLVLTNDYQLYKRHVKLP